MNLHSNRRTYRERQQQQKNDSLIVKNLKNIHNSWNDRPTYMYKKNKKKVFLSFILSFCITSDKNE